MINCSAPKSVHITPLPFDLHSHLLPCCIWYSFCDLLHLHSPCSTLNTEIFHVPKDGQNTVGEILLILQTFDLEHSSYFCQALIFIFQVKTEKCILICLFLLSLQTHHQYSNACICSVCVYVLKCAYVKRLQALT